MRLTSFEMITRALDTHAVRYLVAGGLAVNAHGVLRFTKDLDLVVELIPENVMQAFEALAELGYRPSVPVSASQFSDEATRRQWIEQKGMQVLQFWSDTHRETPIDVFVYEPFLFAEEYARALVKPLYGRLPVRFVSLPTLIAMKRAAGRPEDLADIRQLELKTDPSSDE